MNENENRKVVKKVSVNKKATKTSVENSKRQVSSEKRNTTERKGVRTNVNDKTRFTVFEDGKWIIQ